MYYGVIMLYFGIGCTMMQIKRILQIIMFEISSVEMMLKIMKLICIICAKETRIEFYVLFSYYTSLVS